MNEIRMHAQEVKRISSGGNVGCCFGHRAGCAGTGFLFQVVTLGKRGLNER